MSELNQFTHTAKKMEIVILGKGQISERINLVKPKDIIVHNYGIRNLMSNNFVIHNYASTLKSANFIVYLGYHYSNIIGNIIQLYKTLKFLKKINWKGGFIFLNTQATLFDIILKKRTDEKKSKNYNLYSATKKTQSILLKKFDNSLTIYELFLPIVSGKDTKAEEFYESMLIYDEIYLPNKGKSGLALLDVSLFSRWLWEEIKKQNYNGSSNLKRKIFIYSCFTSPYELIKYKYELSGKLFNPDIIKDIKKKYQYSDSIFKEAILKIKYSILGLLLSIVKEQIFLLFRKSNKSEIHTEKNIYPSSVFTVSESEYYFFSRNIFLSLIPFKSIKINL